MPQSRFIGIVCVILNGVTLTTICVAWKVQGIRFEKMPYLLGCVTVATMFSMARLSAVCIPRPDRLREGIPVITMSSVLEIIALAAGMALLFIPAPAVVCMRGAGPADFCRSVVSWCQDLMHTVAYTASDHHRHRHRVVDPVDALDRTCSVCHHCGTASASRARSTG